MNKENPMNIDFRSAKRLVHYGDRNCLICNIVFVKSFFISLNEREFFLCQTCHEKLKEVLL